MTINELFAGQLAGNLEFLKNTLADFTDADMLVRPTPGANNAAWQLGHLVSAETGMVNGIKPGTMPELPAGFKERFTKETTNVDDGRALGTKEELLALMAKARAASIQWAKSLSSQELDEPGPERMRRMCPKVADVPLLLIGHVTMHVGQFQVIRRRLGKPVLF